MKAIDKGKSNTWDMDHRVRERNIQTGKLDPKQFERYLADLPDLEGHFEIVDEPQPALNGNGES
jgi:hypothetical protein